jgi:hypothetical protein
VTNGAAEIVGETVHLRRTSEPRPRYARNYRAGIR